MLQRIHHVAYRCNDAKETVSFYRDHLGMAFKLVDDPYGNDTLERRIHEDGSHHRNHGICRSASDGASYPLRRLTFFDASGGGIGIHRREPALFGLPAEDLT